MTQTKTKTRPVTVTEPTRIMVVVGMASRRSEIMRWLDGEADLAVVAAHRTAGGGAADMARAKPDVVVLDPETAAGGFAELAELAMAKPDLPILMVRADGSPGAPVTRFGEWGEGRRHAEIRGGGTLAMRLVAAIRDIGQNDPVEMKVAPKPARPAPVRLLH